jgi:hypothetical protein
MLSKSGSNLLHFATYLLRFLLRICYIFATFPATYQLHVDDKTAGPATFWHQGMRLAHVRSRDDGRARTASCQINPEVNLAALRTVKLLPAFLTRLIDKSCAIRMSGGQVSSCQRPYTRAPPFGVGDTRACFSYRIAKDGRHDPDIHSLRQSGRGQPLSGAREAWLALFDS